MLATKADEWQTTDPIGPETEGACGGPWGVEQGFLPGVLHFSSPGKLTPASPMHLSPPRAGWETQEALAQG